MNNEIFFILGCQRSGTTLMRLVLDSHSLIKCFDETRSYDILKNYDLFLKSNQNNKQTMLFGFKTLGYTEQMSNILLSEPVKNTTIKNEWSSKKMIFIYRNAYDVISSMKKYIQKNNRSWLDNWVMLTINFWKRKIPEFDRKFRDELNYAENSKNKLISYAAIYWKFKTQSMLYYQNKKFQIIKIKYENLVSSPKSELNDITKFLNIDWENSLLSHNTMTHDEVDENGITLGMNDSKKPIHVDSIGLSQKYLSDKEKQDIHYITNDLLSMLGYF